ncbi:MAG TPA: cytochrome C [Candidatus Brocadiia bacterium]
MKKAPCKNVILFITLSAVLTYFGCATKNVVSPTSTLNSATEINKISVQCKGCGEIVVLDGSKETIRHNCGAAIDALKIFQAKNALLSKFESVSEEDVRKNGCLACHEGIEEINPKMAFIQNIGGRGKGCSVCHEGNPNANTREEAHKGMYSNPSNLWLVADGKGCGKCHSKTGSIMQVTSNSSDPHGQEDHAYRMQRGLMSTTMGIIASTLSANGLLPIGVRKYANVDVDAPFSPVPLCGTEIYKEWVKQAIGQGAIDHLNHVDKLVTFDEAVKEWGVPKAMMVDYYRKECARCHLWTDGAKYRGDRRAGGCAACHVLYSNNAHYEGNDPTIFKEEVDKPLMHKITTKIPSVQCTRCHTRGKRIGTNFVGIMEFPYNSPFTDTGMPQVRLHDKRYLHIGADVHYQRGMECVDCHTSADIHGDGNIYPTTDHAVEIECTDCHGTPTQYPWELPIGYGDALELKGNIRSVFVKEKKEYILTARGNPFGNVLKEGERLKLIDSHGNTHEVPVLKSINSDKLWKTMDAEVAMSKIPHLKRMECYSCHSVWAPQCYGCHLKEDFSGKTTGGVKTQVDWLTSTWNHDAYGRTQKTETPGKIEETRSYLRWERPILGINKESRIGPVIPGCQVIATLIDENGNPVVVNKPFQSSLGIAGIAMNPAQPHTVQREARKCESCHVDPKTIGYGIDGGVFANLANPHQGDLPDVQKTETQIPAIIDFPYDLSTLVTREGKQTQTMSYPNIRPLNGEERNLVERNGLCIGCHQYYDTPEWDKLKEEMGEAGTADKHSEMMSKAIQALMGLRKD